MFNRPKKPDYQLAHGFIVEIDDLQDRIHERLARIERDGSLPYHQLMAMQLGCSANNLTILQHLAAEHRRIVGELFALRFPDRADFDGVYAQQYDELLRSIRKAWQL